MSHAKILAFEIAHENDTQLNSSDQEKYCRLLKTLDIDDNTQAIKRLQNIEPHRPLTHLEKIKMMLLFQIRPGKKADLYLYNEKEYHKAVANENVQLKGLKKDESCQIF